MRVHLYAGYWYCELGLLPVLLDMCLASRVMYIVAPSQLQAVCLL